jgi:hypothetical protein
MSSLLKCLLIACFASSSLVFAQVDQPIPYVHEKTHLLPSGKKVHVNLRERRCKSGECREVDGGMWGMDTGIPRVITETFRVRIDGQPFLIPEKFYKDFINTHGVNVIEDKERIILELKGGDGAGAYTARFVLGGMCGFERRICGEICEEIWERTTWYNSFAYEADPLCKSGIQ